MSKLVSIYITTKNRSNLLRRAVKSVFDQTYKNIEIIIVDDGSSDDTGAFLDNLKDKRVLVIKNNFSVGAQVSRNIALHASSGHYITGLDDDDYFSPDRVQSFIDFWDDDCDFSFLYSDSFSIKSGEIKRIDRPNHVCAMDILKSNCIGNQIFTKKSNIIEVGCFDEEMPAWQDLDLIYSLILKNNKIGHVNKATYFFDENDRIDRISKKNKDRIIFAYNAFCKKFNLNKKEQQLLYMQVMSPNYNFKIEMSDFSTIFSKGFFVENLAHILKTLMRRWLV
ncbi:glycosyltransferase [Sphaerotilus natans]|uniref:glycosyltransferase n=1 Tax=Sphaerotilus natans TaxID=34103 RepID=UPI00406BF370